ncbi:MAG: T9SS type A sorting domain-containing protein [Bacteroidales bacterium]|jgi:hypothetical protein|nr:T9SS type A sorting domain-containing protein [Bacteroidales bacterium]MDD3701032.1 T9SS type A sorting domain-containing protein [Bacteroidales bacterium]MDY0370630.1 T9SS type A sorting domain-containing protein [Bacteroidales bacterium]
MKKLIIICMIVHGIVLHAQSPYPNIKIGNFNGPNEPSIAINHKNPLEMMAGSNLNYWYYSVDGGYSWTGGVLESPEYGVWGDPVIIADTIGDFYFFHLSNPINGSWIDRIVCQKFDKETLSWSAGTYMGLNGTKAQDKPWAVVDPRTNTIYVSWTQFDEYGSSDPQCESNILFSKSTDGGESWSEAIRINEVAGDCIDSGNTVEGAVPAVGPNGEVYIAWSGPEGIVFNRSIDGGESWLGHNIFVTEQLGGWDLAIPGIYRANGMPITRCDLSGGPNHGTIYINYADQSNGTHDTDVWVVKSTDGGFTWSEPIRVNDDPAGKHQFFTWMEVDQANGTLYFVFYDRRNHSDNNTDVFMAISRDSGNTFENIRISESPFLPANGQFFGDYNNISVVNNIVRPIWTRRESNGKLSLYTAIIDMSVTLPEKEEHILALEQNFPNPFIQYTLITYKLFRPSAVRLSLHDALGRELKVLINNQQAGAGKHTYVFDNTEHQIASGAYFLVLTSDQQQRQIKILISENSN